MKSRKFESMISKKLVIFVLIITVVAEVILYITFSYYGKSVSHIKNDMIKDEISYHINNDVNKLLEKFNSDINQLKYSLKILQNEHENLFQADEQEYSFTGKYLIHPNGALYNRDTGGSSLYFTSKEEYSETDMNNVYLTEQMDETFKLTVESNDIIGQVYFNSKDNMNRLYPFLNNSPVQFGSTLELENHIFYYLADNSNNPDRTLKWTPPYVDPAGLGWVISGIIPIYNGNTLEGVTGIDVELIGLFDNIINLNMKFPFTSIIYDGDFNLFAISDKSNKVIDINIDDFDYVNSIKKDIFISQEYSFDELLGFDNNEAIINSFKNEFPSESIISTDIIINDKKYILIKSCIKELNWKLAILIDYDEINTSLVSLNNKLRKIITITNIFILFTNLLIAFIALKMSRKLTSQLLTPLHKVENMVISFTENKVIQIKPESLGIEEMDTLFDYIYNMITKISTYTDDLIKAEKEKKHDEIRLKLLHEYSFRDMLTQLYNRRKIEECLDSEINRSNRHNSIFSVLMLDIDFFKRVNDELGHDVGDIVLKELSSLLSKSIRTTDILGRWGGEEFIVVSPELNLFEAEKLAEKLRKAVESYSFVNKLKKTISIGVVQYNNNSEDKYQLFKRVDSLLYRAKEAGRNCVKIN